MRWIIIICLVIDLVLAFGLWRLHEKGYVFCPNYNRTLKLFCGPDDQERRIVCGERILCAPLSGQDGHSI
jgi:hypothetical protein